tara:strand:- start:445 stop:1320 length:876 start_codon:yes stop_codon:yes gene_type:complete
MIKFKILMPCFNDWDSVYKLIENIDKEVSKIKAEFSIIIVNDGSNQKRPQFDIFLKNLKSVQVINVALNQGHTKSNATGIKYLSKFKDFDYLILMDGDGEDRPEEIKLLVEKVLVKKNISIVAKRVKRSEGIIFEILYNIHKLITYIFTGKNMNFGHYSCLTRNDLEIISKKKNLWGNYSGTVKKYIKNLDNIPCIRGKRYVQPSKMSFFKLVIHSFSILGVFKLQVLFRSILFLLISVIIFSKFTALILGFFISFFTLLVFLVSTRESLNKLQNSEKNISNIELIHTMRL